MSINEKLAPENWCELSYQAQREVLAQTIRARLAGHESVVNVWIEAGLAGREYDFTVAVETDVGILRTPLWSHARAKIFCDSSVHPANRERLAPDLAADVAAEVIARRIEVPFALEPRGLTVRLSVEGGVERTWSAERARFRNQTAVVREDRVINAAEDLDLRDLLAHFYTGPSLRLVGSDGEAFLLPAASEAEGPHVSLCPSCRKWQEGSLDSCPNCGDPVDVIIAARPSRR